MHPPAFPSQTKFLLPILLGIANVSWAAPSTETAAFVGAGTTNDYKTSSTGAPLTSSRSREGSTVTTYATPGLMTISASSMGSPNSTGTASGTAAAQDTYTITGGSGPGIATFTFYVTGSLVASRTSNSLATYDVSFDYSPCLSGRSDQNGDSGSHPPQTINFTRNFTYGVPFDLRAALHGSLAMPNGSSGSVDITLRCGGYSVSGAPNYSGTSNAGTTRGTLRAPGAAYDGIKLANNRGYASTISLLDGVAGAQRNLAINFLAPIPGLGAVSDVVDVKGTGNDLVVLQVGYNEAAALAAGGGAENVILSRFDEVAGLWKNAADAGLGGILKFISGAYVPADHHEAGTWGIDRAADVVWAVLQHNSQFAALPGQLPAPPTDYASWKTLNFSEAERGDVAISGPEADPDGDGLGNIQEYAFLTAPRRFSPNPVTGSITQAGDSPPYLTITYKRRKGTSGRLILGSCPSLVPTLRILPWVSTCPRSTILMAAKPLLTGITPHSRISWGVVLPAFGLALRKGKQGLHDGY